MFWGVVVDIPGACFMVILVLGRCMWVSPEAERLIPIGFFAIFVLPIVNSWTAVPGYWLPGAGPY